MNKNSCLSSMRIEHTRNKIIGGGKMILQGRLAGFQRMCLDSLLDMMYTPSELAGEIGITTCQVYRVYVPLGCPVQRDKRHRLWINGKAFAEWYEETYPRVSLQFDEGFCLTCKKAVAIGGSVAKKVSGRLSYLVFNCPHCGRKVARIMSIDKS